MNVTKKSLARILLLCVGGALLIPIYKILLTSAVFVYAVYPSKKLFKRVVKHNGIASLLCTLFWTLLFVYFLFFMVNMVVFAVEEARTIIDSEMFVNLASQIKEILSSNPIGELLIESVSIHSIVAFIASSVSSLLVVAPGITIQAGLVILFSYYFLKDGDKMRDFVMSAFPSGSKKKIKELISKINLVFANIVYGYVFTAVIIGLLVFTMFTVLSIPNSFLLAVMATVLSIIPLAGPLIPSIIAAISLLLGESYFKLALLVLFNVAISFVDNIIRAFISDKTSRDYKIHPLLFLCGMVSGPVFFGPIGLITGPMVFGALSVLLKEIE
jgi:predicted PurR-regulated permease PerM